MAASWSRAESVWGEQRQRVQCLAQSRLAFPVGIQQFLVAENEIEPCRALQVGDLLKDELAVLGGLGAQSDEGFALVGKSPQVALCGKGSKAQGQQREAETNQQHAGERTGPRKRHRKMVARRSAVRAG